MPEVPADGLAMAELRQRVSLQSTTLLGCSVDTENADFPPSKLTLCMMLIRPFTKGECMGLGNETRKKKYGGTFERRWN